MIAIAQLLAPGTADDLLNGIFKLLIALASGLFIWFVRNLPKMAIGLKEFPAQIATLREGLKVLEASMTSKLDDLRNDVRALATSNAVRDANGLEFARRLAVLESWRERVTEHRENGASGER